MMTQYQKFVKDVGLVGFFRLLGNLRSIILLPILTKSLGAEGYGIWVQLLVGISFFTPIAMLGAQEALVRFLPATKHKNEQAQYVWSLFIITFTLAGVFAGIILLFSQPIYALFGIPPHFLPFLGGLIMLQTSVWVLQSVFQAFQKNGWLAFFLFAIPAGEIVFIPLAIWSGYGLFGAIIAFTLVRVFMVLGIIILVLSNIGITLPRFTNTKAHLRFGIPLIVSTLSYRVVMAGDTFLISWLLGAAFVGYYSPAYSFGLLLHIAIVPLGMLLGPAITKLFTERREEEVKMYLSRSLRYLLFLLFPAALGLAVFAKPLLYVFSTAEIAEQSFFIIPFSAASFVLYGVYIISVQPLYLHKKTRVVGAIWAISAAMNIILNLILIPIIGLWGAASATLATYAFAASAARFKSSQYLKVPIIWKPILKSLLASALMAFALLQFSPAGILQLFIAVLGGAIIYAILMLLFRAFTRKELYFLKIWRESSEPNS